MDPSTAPPVAASAPPTSEPGPSVVASPAPPALTAPAVDPPQDARARAAWPDPPPPTIGVRVHGASLDGGADAMPALDWQLLERIGARAEEPTQSTTPAGGAARADRTSTAAIATEADPLVPSPRAADHVLVRGDNRAVLTSLASAWRGRFALAYLDPPYNVDADTEHYKDRIPRPEWLSTFAALCRAVRPLMAHDGVVIAQLDKAEQATARLIMDETLGEHAFVTTIAVRMSATSGFKRVHLHKTIVKNVEFLHVYSPALRLRRLAYEPSAYDTHYSMLLDSTDDRTRYVPLTRVPRVAALLQRYGLRARPADLRALHAASPEFRELVIAWSARICRTHTAPNEAMAAFAAGALADLGPAAERRVFRGRWGGRSYLVRRTKTAIDQLIPLAEKVRTLDQADSEGAAALSNALGDWWDGFHLDMGNVQREDDVRFPAGKKPKRLIRRLLKMFSDPGDWVLDPFTGSGTVPAVCLETGRRSLGIDAGPQLGQMAWPRLVSTLSRTLAVEPRPSAPPLAMFAAPTRPPR